VATQGSGDAIPTIFLRKKKNNQYKKNKLKFYEINEIKPCDS